MRKSPCIIHSENYPNLNSPTDFGEEAKNLISSARFDEIAKVRTDSDQDLLGLLQAQGVLTAAQVSNILTELKVKLIGEARRLGEIAVQRMMITTVQLEQVITDMDTQASPPSLGDALIQGGLITQDQAESLAKGLTVGESIGDIGSRLRERSAKLAGSASSMSVKDKILDLPPKMKLGVSIGLGVLLLVILIVALSGGAEIIDNCTLNGYGKGQCAFTNKGSSGSVCGKLYAECDNGKSCISKEICSGELDTDETRTVSISFVGLQDIASDYYNWRDHCSFIWVENN